MNAPPIRLLVLGPTEVLVDGRPVSATRQDLRVLTTLAHLGQPADAEVVEALAWREPPSPRALTSSVFRLQQLLGKGVLLRRRRGIGLERSAVAVDADEFVLASAARELDPAARLDRLRDAIGLVRGVPFATMGDLAGWQSIRARWDEHVARVRDEVVALLEDAGDDEQLVALCAAPLAGASLSPDSVLRAVGALARLGRHREALTAIATLRRWHGSGLDERLVALEQEVLMGRAPAPLAPTDPPASDHAVAVRRPAQPDDLLARAALLARRGPSAESAEVLDLVVRSCDLVPAGDGAILAQTARAGLALADDRVRGSRAVRPVLHAHLAVGEALMGHTAAALEERALAIAGARELRNPAAACAAVRVLLDAPPSVAFSLRAGLGPLVAELSHSGRVSESQRVMLAAAAHHVDVAHGRSSGRMPDHVLDSARATTPEVRRLVLRLAVDDLLPARESPDLAMELSRELAGGATTLDERRAGRAGALVYRWCASIRAQQTTFDDPAADELEMLAGIEGDRGPAATRWTMVQAVRAAMRHDVRAFEAAAQRLVATAVPRLPLPSASVFAATGHLLSMAPEWTALRAADLCAPPVRGWSADVDHLLAAATHALTGGNREVAAQLLRSIDRPVLDASPSPWWALRLPHLALLVRELGDPLLATVMLRLHRGAGRLDLCHLPLFHLGPAAGWLALLADAAGDPSAATLRERAEARWAELRAAGD